MSSFNLVQIVPSLNSGGVEKGTVDVANFLAKKKLSNHIISNGGSLVDGINKEYTSHHCLPVHSKNFFYYPFIANKISNYIKSNKINIVHVRSRAPAWIISFLSKRNIQTISTFHNVYGGDFLLKKIYNRQMANSNHVIAISNYVKNSILKKYNLKDKKITVINRGIDTDFFDDDVKDSEKKQFLEKYKIDKNKKIILYPGRITEWKGQHKFLNNIEKLNLKNFIVLFAGSISNLSHTNLLKKTIKDKSLTEKCMLIGDLNYNQLKIAYSISDLILSLPSRSEGFGRTISETLSMKKIILAKNIGGVYDQLENQENLFKIDDKDLHNLDQRIKNIFDLSQIEKKNIGEKSRQHIIDNFSIKTMVTNYYNFYEQISL